MQTLNDPPVLADFKDESVVVIGKVEIDIDGEGDYQILPDVIDFGIDTNIEDEVSRFYAYSFNITCLNTNLRYFSWNTASPYYGWLKQGRRIKIWAGIKVNSTDYYYQWIIGRVDSYSLSTVAGEEICNIEGRDFMRTVLDYKLYSPNTHWGTSITFDTVAEQADYGMPSFWDISTAIYDSKSLDVSGEDDFPGGLFLNPDGNKLYITGKDTIKIYQYTLSTPWDISTAIYDSKSLDVSGEDNDIWDLFFKPDGSKVYMIGIQNNAIYQYTLSTPWDISTGSFDIGKSLDVSGEDGIPSTLFFNPDGNKVYMIGSATDTIYQYTLATPWDISTATYDNKSFDISTEDTSPSGLFIKSDGSKVYITGYNTDAIYQYSLPGCTGIYIAYLDSINPYDGSHLSPIYKGLDFGYVETDNLLSFYADFKPSYNGTNNLVVYYYQAQSIENVVGDILLAAGIFSTEGEKNVWLADADAMTPTGKEIDRVWFEIGTSAFEAIRLLAEVAQYRFYFDYEAWPAFKPKSSIGTSVDTFSNNCIKGEESSEDIDEVYNHIIVVGEKRETLG